MSEFKFIPEEFETWFESLFGDQPAYTPEEIAEKLGCSPETIRRRLRMADIDGFKLKGGDRAKWVIFRDALKKWLIESYWLNREE